MMKRELSHQVVKLGRQVGEWLAELTEEDLEKVEHHLDTLVARVQKEYGWSPERAKREVAATLGAYSDRTQAVVDRTLDKLNARFHSKPKAQKPRRGWGGKIFWVAFSAAVAAVAWKVIDPTTERR
jgi:uncharacterized protein YjbJ (UPF0337 family)